MCLLCVTGCHQSQMNPGLYRPLCVGGLHVGGSTNRPLRRGSSSRPMVARLVRYGPTRQTFRYFGARNFHSARRGCTLLGGRPSGLLRAWMSTQRQDTSQAYGPRVKTSPAALRPPSPATLPTIDDLHYEVSFPNGHSPLISSSGQGILSTPCSTSPVSSVLQHSSHSSPDGTWQRERRHRRTSSDPMSTPLSTAVLLKPTRRSQELLQYMGDDDSSRPWHEDRLRVQRALARRADFNQRRRNTPSPLSSLNASANASRSASPSVFW